MQLAICSSNNKDFAYCLFPLAHCLLSIVYMPFIILLHTARKSPVFCGNSDSPFASLQLSL